MDGLQKLLILGAGSFAPEVANIAAEIGSFEVTAFVDNRPSRGGLVRAHGVPVLSLQQAARLADSHLMVCALGTTRRRDDVGQAEGLGFSFATLVHPKAHVPQGCSIDAGTIIAPGAILGHGAGVGEHVIVNRGSLIGHHTMIGAYVSVSPGANIAANVVVGEGAYIGMGAIILDGRKVGARAVVGAGAVVTRDVPEGVQVVGVPARITKRGVDGL